MKTEVRINFDGKQIPGGAQAILGPARCGPDVATVNVPVLWRREARVTLEETDPRVGALRELLSQHGVSWMEYHEDRYTEEELNSARLLLIQPNDRWRIDGGVQWGTTYDLSNACPACGSGGRQTSALFVNGEQLSELEGRRAAATVHGHLLVEDGLAAELESLGATGLSLRSVYALMPDKQQVRLRWKQLCAARTLPPVSPRTTGLERDDRDQACKVCLRTWYFWTYDMPVRIVYSASDLIGADDVTLTWEREGFAILEPEPRERLLSYPWMLVTPKVRRVFRDAGVTCFDWLPIRVEEADEQVESKSLLPESRRPEAERHATAAPMIPVCQERFMRTEVRLFFSCSHIPGGAQAILGPARCGPDVATVTDGLVRRQVDVCVTLEETDPRLPVLLQLLKQHGESWLDLRRDHYTEEELDSARLIIMESKNADEVFGGPRLGTAYDLEGACSVCGAGARQTSALMIEDEELPKLEGLRATSTYYSDIIVDERLAEELENIGATGLSFRSVYAVMPDKRQIKLRWRQLCAAHTLPPMSPRSTGVERGNVCASCGRSGFSTKMDDPCRLAYRAQDLVGSEDVNTTWEWFGDWSFDGDVSNALFAYPWVLVTPKVRRVFRDAGVTSFHWLPIRVEDAGL